MQEDFGFKTKYMKMTLWKEHVGKLHVHLKQYSFLKGHNIRSFINILIFMNAEFDVRKFQGTEIITVKT